MKKNYVDENVSKIINYNLEYQNGSWFNSADNFKKKSKTRLGPEM